MRKSSQVPVEVNCERLGIRQFPIAGYPHTCYKENFESVHAPEVNRRRFPSLPIHVEAQGYPVAACRIPRYRLNYYDKLVEIPVVQNFQKIVEVPEVREITKYVPTLKVVDVPVEEIRMIPRLQIREIEKIRHVPGRIQYIDVPQEHIVHRPVRQIVEKIHEIPVIEDIEVEVPIYVPTPVGPPEDIHIDIPLPYDVPQFCYRPDRLVRAPVQIPEMVPMQMPERVSVQMPERVSMQIPERVSMQIPERVPVQVARRPTVHIGAGRLGPPMASSPPVVYRHRRAPSGSSEGRRSRMDDRLYTYNDRTPHYARGMAYEAPPQPHQYQDAGGAEGHNFSFNEWQPIPDQEQNGYGYADDGGRMEAVDTQLVEDAEAYRSEINSYVYDNAYTAGGEYEHTEQEGERNPTAELIVKRRY